MTWEYQNKVDTAAGGAIGGRTAVEMNGIYKKLSESTRQKCEHQINAQVFHGPLKRIRPMGGEAHQPWKNLREVAMEIRPGPCRWCSSYEHSVEMCPAGIKNFEKRLGRKENSSYSKDYHQSRNSYNDVFRLEQHQYREEGEHYEDVKRALIETSLQMKALIGKNDELARSLGELIKKTEIKEEQHQLQYTQHQFQIERLTDQLEQVWATHVLRSGKVIDNKVGMDTNLPYKFVQEPEIRGEQNEE